MTIDGRGKVSPTIIKAIGSFAKRSPNKKRPSWKWPVLKCYVYINGIRGEAFYRGGTRRNTYNSIRAQERSVRLSWQGRGGDRREGFGAVPEWGVHNKVSIKSQ